MISLLMISTPALAQYEGDLTYAPSMLESVQCNLDLGRTVNIQYSLYSQEYVEVNAIAQYFNSFLEKTDDDDDDGSSEFPIVPVRVCWCSQYFNRRYEYCPAAFDSCRVEGFEGPITCFHSHEGGAFVRGFWFICVFWFTALLYAFSCTEQGSSARAYLKRKLCSRCCFPSMDTQHDVLRADVERMIQRDPDRATWLLRSAFLRQQMQHREGRQRRLFLLRSDIEENNEESGNDAMATPNRETLELKVKRFQGESSDETEESSDENTGSDPSNNKVTDANGEQDSSNFSFAQASQLLSSALASLSVNTEVDDMDCVKCAICLSTVQKGDRIGDIPCGHIYCVDCLKDWLKRKNHCPLCHREGLATPVVSPLEARHEATTDEPHVDPEQGRTGRRAHPPRNQGLVVSMPDILPSRSRTRSRRSSS